MFTLHFVGLGLLLLTMINPMNSANQQCTCNSRNECQPKEKWVDFRKEGCQLTRVHVNSCSGCCGSFTASSIIQSTGNSNDKQFISKASCCSIADSHRFEVALDCSYGVDVVEIQNATRCSCSTCRDT